MSDVPPQGHPAGSPQYGPPGQPAYPGVPGGYGPPPGYELKQKKPFYKKAWFWVLAIIFLVIILIFAACAALVGGVASSIDDANNEEHSISYEVTSTASQVSLTYTTSGSNGVEQQSNAAVPFTKEFKTKGIFTAASISATLGTDAAADASVSCKITIDGKVVSQNTSSGQFASVSCTGSGSDNEIVPSGAAS